MDQMTRYQQLNPTACAIAAGCTALILVLILGFPMMGTGMMGGGYGMMAHGYGMMAHGYGMGIAWWLGGAVVTALAGALFAWIYNALTR